MIPARAASTRLPGKALADIAGLPMVVHVARRAAASGAARVIVATDDAAIQRTVAEHGFEAILTAPEHPTGTDRLAEACARLALPDEAIVVNVQGDEPLIDPALVAAVAALLAATPDAAIATAAHPIASAATVFNPNAVKVVCDARAGALYFSRAPIPWARDAWSERRQDIPAGLPVLQHVGLYAYRVEFLRRFPLLEQGVLERFESLEQLRALEHGYRIVVHTTGQAPAGGVDTEDDLARVRQALGHPAGMAPMRSAFDQPGPAM